MSGQTCTIDASGKLLTVEQEGVSMPADYSFRCVNDYVHDAGRHFEELQCLALGMANEIERLRKYKTDYMEAAEETRRALVAEAKAMRQDAALGSAIQRACSDLPEGFMITVWLEKDAGTMELGLPDTDAALDAFDGDTFADQINKAIDAALQATP